MLINRALAPRTALIGRDGELAEILNHLQRPEVRLLTLTGVGGTGKTRLALQLAADLAPDYPHRTWVIELSSVTDIEMLPIVVATTIGLREDIFEDPLLALSKFLGPEPALLVLDDCEHLVRACAILVDALLCACPNLLIIATSREPLLIAGERQHRVPPLEVPDPQADSNFNAIASSPAVDLFASRAQDVVSSFQLTPDNAPLVARICARLGGIPLALELAAAQVHVLGLEQILSRLNDEFRDLNSGSRVAPTRHQTLRAALDWSDELLSPDERTIFHRLSVFAGEFHLEAAEAVCAGTDLPISNVFAALTGLVNKSLVLAKSGDSLAWYSMLEPVRHYALHHLEQAGDEAETRARYAQAYLTMAERAAVELCGPGQETWLFILDRERGNLRAVMEWANRQHDPSLSLRLAAALTPYWDIRGHFSGGLYWHRRALNSSPEHCDPSARMRALRGLGWFTLMCSNDESRYDEAEAFCQESFELATSIDDQHGIAAALTELGMVRRLQGDLDRSADLLEQSLELFRSQNDARGIATALLHLGCTVNYLGDASRATHLISESLERYRAMRDARWTAIAQIFLSQVMLTSGDAENAGQLAFDAVTTHSRLDDWWFVTYDLMTLAKILMHKKRRREAVQLVGAANAKRHLMTSPVGGASIKALFPKIDELRGEDWFQAAWDEGHTFDVDATLDIARIALGTPELNLKTAKSSPKKSARLTRRELQVARLLSGGYTDRQIAEELFVSTGTVSNHVHHILRKTGLHSRVQIADWLVTRERADASSP